MVTDNIMIIDSAGRTEHSHLHIELLYVINGSLDIWCTGRKIRRKRGDLWIVNSGEGHSILCGSETLYCEIAINYNWICDNLGCRPISFDNEILEKSPEKINIIQVLVNQILTHYVNRGKRTDFYGEGLFYELLDALITGCMKKNEEWNSDKSQRVRQISSYVYQHFRENITLNNLAERLYLSNAYLSRYFKKQFKMTFMEYLNKVRMENATDLLVKTDMPVTKIALECGFATPSIFNRKFRDIFHTTPSAYRQEKQEKQAQEDTRKQVQTWNKVKAYYEKHGIENEIHIPVHEKQVNGDVRVMQELLYNKESLLNIGSARDILQSDIQQHIIGLNRKIGIDYLRFWTPFSKAMMLDLENPEQDYNFEMLDKVLDFLVSEGIHPFIELGSKPRRIQKSANEFIVFEYEGDEFGEMKKWKSFLKQWMRHLEERYGIEEVELWRFEIWRKEKSPQSGTEKKIVWYDNYYELFKETYECIKSRFPNAQVGGCGIKIADYKTLRHELEEWKVWGHLPDFFSIYLYAYELEKQDDSESVKRSSDAHFIERIYARFKEALKELQLDHIPVYATEWNLSISDRNVVNDSCARAAYLLHTRIRWAEEALTLGCFYGSDCLSEHKDTRRLLFGAAGLLTKNGILKPAAYAMQFASRIAPYIIKRGEHYLITTDKKGNYDIICENYKQFSYLYYLREENEVELQDESSVFENVEVLELKFLLENMIDGLYEIKKNTVNNAHGSVCDEWKKYQCSTRIGFEDIEYFRHVCVPEISARELQTKEGTLEFAVKMAPHEINYVHIKYLHE